MRAGLLLAGRYELDEPVGRGGMGQVWRAYDQFLDRRVAVKFVSFPGGRSDEELIRRFEQEARNTARLEHPGVPAVHDRGEHDDERLGTCFYLVMQYVDGTTVELLLDQGPLPVGWAALIAAQVCAVLAVAHERSLVHRDLKPANLILAPDGSVKVLDFGLAVGLLPTDVRLTATGVAGPGTPGYTAPEQLYGNPSPQSDMYSLGCVLYTMLTGEPVFGGDNTYSVYRAHEEQDPEPPSHRNPEVPPGLDDLVLRLLAKAPADRPAGAAAVQERLAPFITGLHPLYDVVTQAPAPSSLYGALVGAIRLDGPPAAEPAPAAAHARPDAPPAAPVALPTAPEIRRGRTEAGALMEAGRYGQAADLLSRLAGPAALALGELDEEVVELRAALAEALYLGGDHRRAAPALRTAVATLAEWHGPDDELVLRYREWEADCLALLGEPDRALRRLEPLARHYAERDRAADRLRLLGKIGRLRMATGRTAAGRAALAEAAAGLAALHGDDHPAVQELRPLL
ncbi:serine/threonine-protein kinase [Actinomadura parmotrematis]|uniref:non-specific serine/threonine protein kinase n=1 Tax=Actinomadura parmotrematis TaxID=2864039 RepID=A0ABS7FYP6_9ACTN|nr:serine/threonine-protein kinase [Actinomadura parmotrematis]MBW8485569.1 serine/threonine protein kinase [Actinomadura parmotrematis]